MSLQGILDSLVGRRIELDNGRCFIKGVLKKVHTKELSIVGISHDLTEKRFDTIYSIEQVLTGVTMSFPEISLDVFYSIEEIRIIHTLE